MAESLAHKQKAESLSLQLQEAQQKIKDMRKATKRAEPSSGKSDGSDSGEPGLLSRLLSGLSSEKKASRAKKPERSAKFPGPPTLTDGKNPPYETWKLRAKDKLRNNADW